MRLQPTLLYGTRLIVGAHALDDRSVQSVIDTQTRLGPWLDSEQASIALADALRAIGAGQAVAAAVKRALAPRSSIWCSKAG